LIAFRTKAIRLGAGGILLRYYSPLKVAETFLVIEALSPDRIDLGVCRGPGVADIQTSEALVSGNKWELTEQVFQRKVERLLCLYGHLPDSMTSEDKSPPARPRGVAPPPVWVLGSGSSSARLAAATGSPYCFMTFFDRDQIYGPQTIAEYRQRFIPSHQHDSPYSSIVLAVGLEDTGFAGGFPESTSHAIPSGLSRKQRAQKIRELHELYATDEVLIATELSGYEERADLYREIAEEFGLAPPG
jgi:luciferase family oxidoreductase group 1